MRRGFDSNDVEDFGIGLDDVWSNTEIGREYISSYHSDKDWEERFDLIRRTAVRVACHEDVTEDHIAQALYLLMQSGKIKPRKAAAAPIEEVPVDTRPKDRLGRPMSGKAQQWQAWEKWCNDEKTTMSEINALRVSDAAFREFYEHQRALRVKEQPNDTFDPAPQQAAAGHELKLFAEMYNKAEARSLRPINGEITLNGQKYSKAAFDALVDAASAARLL